MWISHREKHKSIIRNFNRHIIKPFNLTRKILSSLLKDRAQPCAKIYFAWCESPSYLASLTTPTNVCLKIKYLRSSSLGVALTPHAALTFTSLGFVASCESISPSVVLSVGINKSFMCIACQSELLWQQPRSVNIAAPLSHFGVVQRQNKRQHLFVIIFVQTLPHPSVICFHIVREAKHLVTNILLGNENLRMFELSHGLCWRVVLFVLHCQQRISDHAPENVCIAQLTAGRLANRMNV